MIDKNIVIAVSMKRNGVSPGHPCRPRKKDCPCAVVELEKPSCAAFPPSIASHERKIVCMSHFCKEFEISIACMIFLKCVES